MKIERFTEGSEEKWDEYRLLSDKAKKLFDEVWDSKLQIGKLSINGEEYISNKFYSLYCTIYQYIKNETYDDFKLFFDFLINNNITFKLDGNEFRATIFDINKFINDMELIKNQKKYNI